MGGPRLRELAAAVERHTRVDGTHDTAVPGLTLFRASRPSDPVAVVYEPSVCLIAQGRKVVGLARERYPCDPAQFLLVSADLPVTGQVTEASAAAPFLAVRVGLDPAVVGELLAAGAGPRAMAAAPARGVAVSPVDSLLLDAVARLVGLLDAPADIAALAPLVRREITYRVLTGPQGPRLVQVAAAGGPAQRVTDAVRWLRGHFAEPLRVAALARRARMSASAFHLHFKTVTAMTPVQYQKRLRLQEARRLMLADGLDAAGAGFRVGYGSPSQFSRDYRRLFGAPPRRDVTALRGPAVPV